MIIAIAGLLLVPQDRAKEPYWTWPTAQIIKQANAETKLSLKLEMSLVAIYRTQQIAKSPLLSADDRAANTELEATAYSIAGTSYSRLGDQRRAFTCYMAGINLQPSPERQSQLRNNLAIASNELHRYDDAEKYARQALAFWEGKPLKPDIAPRMARVLNQLGNALQHQGKLQAALETHQRALTLRYLGDGPLQQAGTQQNLGAVLIDLGRSDEALSYLTAALTIQRKDNKNLTDQANTLSLIAAAVKAKTPELAVVILKESVSLIQTERRRIASLPADLQLSYVETNSGPYQQLADLLLKLGRIGEAVRVLDLLKEQEAEDYFRGSGDNLSDVERSASEKAIWELWQKVPEEAGQLFLEYDKLRATPDKKPEDRQRLAELESKLKPVDLAVRDIYADLESRSRASQSKSLVEQDLNDIQRDIRDLNRPDGQEPQPHALTAAALRVFATRDAVVTLLITSDSVLVFRYAIQVEKWNELVGRLAVTLRNPGLDPSEFSLSVYKAIFGKVERELQRRGIKQLECALDGPLRYIPVAALWDGKDYLVNRYEIGYYTPGTNFSKTHRAQWRVAGFAAGESQKMNLPDLPDAKTEVDEIVQDGPTDKGIFEGKQYLGVRFTPENLFETLNDRREGVLHLATHFLLKPKLEDSFFVAGNDEVVQLSALKEKRLGPALFADVDLLYLSACSTAEVTPEGNVVGDGKEVDSFAMFALQQSALTVVATLWSLNDNAGSLLAQAFYRHRKANPKLPLGAVLQQAQLEIKSRPAGGPEVPRSKAKSALPNFTGCPKYKTNPAQPFAHPYYWAPLVLYGSFR